MLEADSSSPWSWELNCVPTLHSASYSLQFHQVSSLTPFYQHAQGTGAQTALWGDPPSLWHCCTGPWCYFLLNDIPINLRKISSKTSMRMLYQHLQSKQNQGLKTLTLLLCSTYTSNWVPSTDMHLAGYFLRYIRKGQEYRNSFHLHTTQFDSSLTGNIPDTTKTTFSEVSLILDQYWQQNFKEYILLCDHLVSSLSSSKITSKNHSTTHAYTVVFTTFTSRQQWAAQLCERKQEPQIL